ncbi:CD209 antigen-like protein E [Rattus rattus]|uniref:CD209 antigen-like protein E n=1 Tax=Rattus rattus TaxID=10117 RepID=UPI0013F31A0E|nr:CD209 antigen-like protein E [Rattus rattus]
MCLDRKPFITVLKLISIVILAALIIAVIVKGTEFLTSQDHDQKKQYIHQVKAGLNSLCRPCPWPSSHGDWKLDSGNCYFFSKYKKNWVEFVNTCKYMGAQPVVIKSNEEQELVKLTQYLKEMAKLEDFLELNHKYWKRFLTVALVVTITTSLLLFQVDGYPGHELFISVLKFTSIVILTALLIAILVKERLCRPCPWMPFGRDRSLFQRNCYFFSKYKRNWTESVKACKYIGAQLLVIKSNEEQSFLNGTSKKKGNSWMGLSYNNKESKWQWVDGSPLQGR